MISILIADDHELVRRGLRMTIAGETDLQLVGEAHTGRQAITLAQALLPDLVLLDIQMPDLDGVAAAAAIRSAHPNMAILMLTSFSADAQIHAALRAGASGYLLKDVSGDALLAAIRGAAHGDPQLHPQIARRLMDTVPAAPDPLAILTPRERAVLKLIGSGQSNREIAAALVLTETTVKGYVGDIFSKLHLNDRTQAALLAVRYGLVTPADLPNLPT